MDPTIPIPTKLASTPPYIHDVPLEVLIDIFLHLYKDPSIPFVEHDQYNAHKLTSIMLVCKNWKDAVERTPSLWTDIWLGRCPPYIEDEGTEQWQEYIKARFARSGTLPLNLTIVAVLFDLEEVSHAFLPHISRCRTLVLRGLPYGIVDFPNDPPTLIYRILSSPFPVLHTITTQGYATPREWESRWQPLYLDAPNLRELNAFSSDIIPFVKPHPPLLSAHPSLERLSLSIGWDDLPSRLPRDRLSLPNLKFLSVAYVDHFWELLQVIDAPNLEHLVVNCGLAHWPEEVDTVMPVMNKLRELEWYTDRRAVHEQPTLRHLLQHCPNITSLSYICNKESAGFFRETLEERELDNPVFAWSVLLHETQGGTLQFCPRLRCLRIACASFEQVQELVSLRPMLEHVSLQARKPGDVTVTGSESSWRAKVNMARGIRSNIEFDFPTDVVSVSRNLREEEGVFWDPTGNTAG
ncbi:hypothetical protein FRC00_007535 [Tulasnella sp. 408]|nr:hypothetical protein FRC00_007535 [Tulasnella sp. 408]